MSIILNLDILNIHIRIIFRVIISRRLRWAGGRTRLEEGMGADNIFTTKPVKRGYLVIPRHKRKTNIIKCFKEKYVNVRNWIDLA